MLYRDPINLDIMQQNDQNHSSQSSQSQDQASYSQQSQSDASLAYGLSTRRRYAHPRGGHLHRMPYPPSYHRLLTPPNEETTSQSSIGSSSMSGMSGMESQRSMGSTTSSRRSMMSMSSIPTLRRQDATVGQGWVWLGMEHPEGVDSIVLLLW